MKNHIAYSYTMMKVRKESNTSKNGLVCCKMDTNIGNTPLKVKYYGVFEPSMVNICKFVPK